MNPAINNDENDALNSMEVIENNDGVNNTPNNNGHLPKSAIGKNMILNRFGAGNENVLRMKQNPSSSHLDKLFQSALKEFHRHPSPIAPNLKRARPRLNTDSDDLSQKIQGTEEWHMPKKTSRRLNNEQAYEISWKENRFAPLDNAINLF